MSDGPTTWIREPAATFDPAPAVSGQGLDSDAGLLVRGYAGA